MPTTLRPTSELDILFLMSAERGPGFDRLLGQSSKAQHPDLLADSDCATLVASRDGEDGGFIWLSGLGDRYNGVCMKRVVSVVPNGRFGTAMVRAGLDWEFANTQKSRAMRSVED